jgi:hypothetical protein
VLVSRKWSDKTYVDVTEQVRQHELSKLDVLFEDDDENNSYGHVVVRTVVKRRRGGARSLRQRL